MENFDEIQMQKVFSLAEKARGFVSPNPMVGALIIKNGKVIGEGFHKKAGMDHAEVDAIVNATEDVRGATLYCNLEPCCHTDKRTPPCADLIIEKGISKVVISNIDSNPKVLGGGIKKLKDAGVEVITGILEEEGKKLNEIFFRYIQTGLPFVHLKMAMSLDGKVALENGESKWITCQESRKLVHQMRFNSDAICVGRKTLNSDNPKLTIRDFDGKGKQPYRVVMGNPNKMALESALFTDNLSHRTIIITHNDILGETPENIIDFLKNNKVQIIAIDSLNPSDFLLKSLKRLGELGITSLFIEGGAGLYSSFIKEGLYDRISAFQAPMFVGKGINVFQDEFRNLSEAPRMNILSSKRVGVDHLLELGK